MMQYLLSIELILQYGQLYGARVTLLFVLSIVTIFRREISCNRVYGHEQTSSEKNNDLQTIAASTNSPTPCTQSLLPPCSSSSSSSSSDKRRLHVLHLPQDVQIHILTFLHPRDIVSFSCCNKKTYSMIHDEYPHENEKALDYSQATRLWFTLWKRDYACILKDWDIGKKAIQRSWINHSTRLNCPPCILTYLEIPNAKLNKSSSTMKDFYFYFSQTWINYTIAGHCTINSCLVGLHGHVFHLASFITLHPGSPETLLMLGGGRDATKLFESLGHSSRARTIASQQLLAIQDASCLDSRNSWGLSIIHSRGSVASILFPKMTVTRGTIHTSRRQCLRNHTRKPGCTWYFRNKIQEDERGALWKASSYWRGKEEQSNVVGSIQVYFDPLVHEWMGWYIDAKDDFVPLFIGTLK